MWDSNGYDDFQVVALTTTDDVSYDLSYEAMWWRLLPSSPPS